MIDPSKIKRGERFHWTPQNNRVIVCTQTDEDTRCGPVFSDPETGHDVLRVSRDEFSTFNCYFVPEKKMKKVKEKKRWVVRVVLFQETHETQSPFLECLRHAGIVKVQMEDDKHVCFDLFPPASDNAGARATKVWADQVASRMASFGYNAVAAPEWKDVNHG